jgi:hypothetical protein
MSEHPVSPQIGHRGSGRGNTIKNPYVGQNPKQSHPQDRGREVLIQSNSAGWSPSKEEMDKIKPADPNLQSRFDLPAASGQKNAATSQSNLLPELNAKDFRHEPKSHATDSPFRFTGHSQSKALEFDPLPVAPPVPGDIRLPDLLPPSVFSIRQDSVLQPDPHLLPALNRHDRVEPSAQKRNDESRFDYHDYNESYLAPSRASNDRFDVGNDTASQAQEIQLPGKAESERDLRSRRNRQLPLPTEVVPTFPEEAYGTESYRSQFSHQPPLMEHLGAHAAPADFRPDLGHRMPEPTQRPADLNDFGQRFDFENKHAEYPGLGEILATGRYFGSTTLLYIRPAFQANTAIFQNLSGVTETFDFSYKVAEQFQFGFESKFGPGIEFDYFGYHDFSRAAQFTSDGIESGTTNAWIQGANQGVALTAANMGETLTARHRMEVDVIGASFFKEVKLPRARINGKFGFETAHIIHEMTAGLQNAGGTQIGSLRSRSDLRAMGPRFEMQYFRPIGHSKIEFLTSIGGSALFGKQSQVIESSAGLTQSRMKADEFVMTLDYFAGAQYRKMWGENRNLFIRGGMLYQVWSHGGTALLPQDDFGFRGFALTIGVNR